MGQIKNLVTAGLKRVPSTVLKKDLCFDDYIYDSHQLP